MEISRANVLMMTGRMILGKVIRFVVGTFAPIDLKLTLANAVAEPVEAHVHGFRTFLFDEIVGNAGCSDIVSL